MPEVYREINSVAIQSAPREAVGFANIKKSLYNKWIIVHLFV